MRRARKSSDRGPFAFLAVFVGWVRLRPVLLGHQFGTDGVRVHRPVPVSDPRYDRAAKDPFQAAADRLDRLLVFFGASHLGVVDQRP